MGNIVAIVGRPNVGKSTFYNRLVGGRDAIVDNQSGVTRDRKYGAAEWNGKKFTLIDTGGFVEGSDDIFEAAIRDQVLVALKEATVILFLVDVETGVTDLDEEVAHLLRQTQKDVFLVVNKVDNNKRYMEANDFWSLGFEHVFSISSMSGSGTGDLLDAVVEKIEDEPELETDLPKFAILGQPNVGKSSIVNALLGEERNIVTDIAGTTRDPIHSLYNKFGMEFMVVDTAGIRKKNKVHEDIEFYSVMRAIKAMEESDVTILMIDATKGGMEAQDMSLLRLIQKRHKGLVILVNKWDLVPKETNTARDMERYIKQQISPFSDVPILFISATEKQRIFKAMEEAMTVYQNRSRKIKTSVLNDYIHELQERSPAPSHRGHQIKIKYVTQLPVAYPAFVMFCNHPSHVRENYKNFIENQMRKEFDFTGVPISIFFREK